MISKKLSASRIDTYNICSWLYWALYHLKIPRSENDGAKRGTVTHLVLELLLKDRHKPNFDRIVSAKSIKGDKAIYKLIRKHCEKFKIWDIENVSLINKFILVGLKNDFFGNKSVKKILPEQEFTISVDDKESGKKYCITGFIDKIFIKESKTKATFIEIFDYKTSSEKFEGEKADFNIQDYIYNIAARNLFPEAEDYSFNFLFLKFPKDPLVKQKKLEDDDVEGFEYYLTELQSNIDNFDEKLARSNFAADKGYPKEGFSGLLKCGYGKFPGHIKPTTGEPYYVCEAKWPFDFWVVENEKGEIVDSAKDPSLLKTKNGQTIKKKRYEGCPKFNK